MIKFRPEDLPVTIESDSEEMTEEIASGLYSSLMKDYLPVFILLEGEMGSGKTAFCRGLAQGAAVESSVNSPTFNILNEYSGLNVRIFHYDFYRLHSEAEIEDLGFPSSWSTAVKDSLQEIHVMEWWQRAEKSLPIHSGIFRIIISGSPDHDSDYRTIEIISYNRPVQ
jgi:tRNA threonylcarbamoyladenosine biosynthesis protein TsaE